jgi:DNA-binding CsgD family transcriptional regulator
VRQYARERLEESGETEATRRQHALWYLALAEEADPKLDGAEQADWLKRLEIEHDNLRVALQWFLERKEAELGLRLAGALGNFWRIRSHLSEGMRWMDATLKIGTDKSSAQAKALAHAGWISWQRLHFERATALSEEALALSRKLGDKKSAAIALHNLGMVAIYGQVRPEEAQKRFEESLALWRELGDMIGISRVLQKIGLVSVVRRDFERAGALYEESLALARKTGDKVGLVLVLWLGALVSLGRGDHGQVRALCEEGLDLALQLGNTHAIVYQLHVLAASAGSQGQPIRSARLWGVTESLAADTLNRTALGPAERHFYHPYIVAAREQLDEEAWEVAGAEGKMMTPEEAVAYALSSKGEAASPTISASEKPTTDEPLNTLTSRQQEIMMLVVRGLTNRRIAEELVISERTVEAHVSRTLKKLGLRSRTQLAARARQLLSE